MSKKSQENLIDNLDQSPEKIHEEMDKFSKMIDSRF